MGCEECQRREEEWKAEEAEEEEDGKASDRQDGAMGVTAAVLVLVMVVTFCVGPNLATLLSIPIGTALGWLLVLRKQQMAQNK